MRAPDLGDDGFELLVACGELVVASGELAVVGSEPVALADDDRQLAA